VWSSENATELRMIAMVGIGVMHVSMDKWWKDGGKRLLSAHVRDGFAVLKSHV
jgi:hypothetical protein